MPSWKRTAIICTWMVCLTVLKALGVELTTEFLLWMSAPGGGYMVAKGKGGVDVGDVVRETLTNLRKKK